MTARGVKVLTRHVFSDLIPDEYCRATDEQSLGRFDSFSHINREIYVAVRGCQGSIHRLRALCDVSVGQKST